MKPMPNTLRRTSGFTLVEMLITVVIVGILATIALPSYRQYVMRTNRTVAKAALQDLVARQESYALDHKGYATNFDRLGIAGSAAATIAYVTSDGVISRNAAGALYSFGLGLGADITSTCDVSTISSPSTLRITATRITESTDTVCSELCISSVGNRGSTSSTAADCWRR